MSLTHTVRVAWNVVEIKGMKSLFFMASSCKNQRIRPNCFLKLGSACPRESKKIMWLLTIQVSVTIGCPFVTPKVFTSRQLTIDI